DVDGPRVVASPSDDHVEGGQLDILVRRVDPPFAADQPEADPADGPVEGKTGDHRGQAGGVDAGDVVRVREVRGEHRHDDLDLVSVAVLERGAQRPVDEASREDGRLRWTTLATEEPAGDLPRGVHPLLEIDGEREEVDPL